MSHLEIVYFAVLLLFALIALSAWKRRRDHVANRLKKGLHSYISADMAAADAAVACSPASIA